MTPCWPQQSIHHTITTEQRWRHRCRQWPAWIRETLPRPPKKALEMNKLVAMVLAVLKTNMEPSPTIDGLWCDVSCCNFYVWFGVVPHSPTVKSEGEYEASKISVLKHVIISGSLLLAGETSHTPDMWFSFSKQTRFEVLGVGVNSSKLL